MSYLSILISVMLTIAWWSPKTAASWAAEFVIAYRSKIAPKMVDLNINFKVNHKEDA